MGKLLEYIDWILLIFAIIMNLCWFSLTYLLYIDSSLSFKNILFMGMTLLYTLYVLVLRLKQKYKTNGE